VLGDNSHTGCDISMKPPKAHPWPKPRPLMHNMWASCARGRLCACARSHRKKLHQSTTSSILGAATPGRLLSTLAYLVIPLTLSFVLYFCYDPFRGFCSGGAENGPFLYSATTAHITQCRTQPCTPTCDNKLHRKFVKICIV
jgi:hypothetical protein